MERSGTLVVRASITCPVRTDLGPLGQDPSVVRPVRIDGVDAVIQVDMGSAVDGALYQLQAYLKADEGVVGRIYDSQRGICAQYWPSVTYSPFPFD